MSVTRMRSSVVAAIAVIALGAAACSTNSSGGGSPTGSKETSGAPTTPYVFGYTSGITGPGAAISKGELVGLNAAFDAVNKAGGVNGRQIKLVTLDSADDPGRTATNVTELVKSDGAIAVGGMLGSAECTATVKLAATYKTPMLCGVADDSNLKPVNPYVFVKYGSEVTEAKAMLSVVKDRIKQPAPKLGFVFIDLPSARQWATSVRAAAAKQGLKTVAFDGIAATTVDLSTEAARLQKAGATIVLTQIVSPQVISLDHALQSQGNPKPIVAEASTADYPTLLSLADPNIYQLMSTPLVDPTSSQPAVKDYVAAMKTQGVPDTMAGMNGLEYVISYVQPMQFVEALKTCGANCNGTSLAAALEKSPVNLPGVDTDYSYTSSRHYPQTYFDLATYNPKTKSVENDNTKYYANPIP
ncbi:MAG: ABC transporter substrate-binding protein [Gordonia polyisoprenivorans]|nr:ABC transporter substrate-binding protein [Gordonia polyisoprenivorans]